MANSGCNKDRPTSPDSIPSYSKTYQDVRLVADASEYHAAWTDENITNPWGIAMSPVGEFWITSNKNSKCTNYDGNGKPLLMSVSMQGKPTGIVYNNSSSFAIPATGDVSKYLFACENGTISSCGSSNSATVVVNNPNAVYKGLAIATDAGETFLYAANFKGNHIDVFDKNFNPVTTKLFEDRTLPKEFAPFNIKNINGKLYVTYAKLKGPNDDIDDPGAGNGYINVFTPNGYFIKRFASEGNLNSPWGIVQAPAGFGQVADAILVGNFGDGKINVFNPNGTYQGQLKNGDGTLTIPGLLALEFPLNYNSVKDQKLYYTSGHRNKEYGIFGYIKRN
ncbi:MAG: hypothetical protein JWN78_3056 [Bacteroidota bacterium]|nr:hypothetical protein [Bacteroidota bacterium]